MLLGYPHFPEQSLTNTNSNTPTPQGITLYIRAVLVLAKFHFLRSALLLKTPCVVSFQSFFLFWRWFVDSHYHRYYYMYPDVLKIMTTIWHRLRNGLSPTEEFIPLFYGDISFNVWSNLNVCSLNWICTKSITICSESYQHDLSDIACPRWVQQSLWDKASCRKHYGKSRELSGSSTHILFLVGALSGHDEFLKDPGRGPAEIDLALLPLFPEGPDTPVTWSIRHRRVKE